MASSSSSAAAAATQPQPPVPPTSSSSSSSSLLMGTFVKIHPLKYHLKFLEQGVRCDGRLLNECRQRVCTDGGVRQANASTVVKIGRSTAICGVKLEVAAPFTHAPSDGHLQVDVHLTPLCSPIFDSTRATNTSVAISQHIHEVLVDSGVIRLADLCIQQGVAVWAMYVDIVFIDYDGGARDTALYATIEALKRVRLPEVHVTDDKEVVAIATSANNNNIVSPALPMYKSIVSFTCGLLDKYLVVDPNGEEADLLRASVTIVLDTRTNNVCTLLVPGGVSVTNTQLQQCITLAKQAAAKNK